MASLLLANHPMIEHVYSYEPFKTAYGRALRNLELNPEQSRKVTPQRLGLSDRDMIMEVVSQDDFTGGNTVKGRQLGNKETIELRDAGRELKAAITEAKERSLGVVIKVDCEGSEFPIFEALERENLFGNIDVFMIEWHKWWSAEKTQQDLIRPLVRAGFAVFDQTRPGVAQGILLAVRGAQ